MGPMGFTIKTPIPMRLYRACSLLIFLSVQFLSGQEPPLLAEDSLAQAHWVDRQYESMTPEQRVGQLFVVMAHSDQGPALEQKIRQKNDVLAELMQEHVQLKKELGEL